MCGCVAVALSPTPVHPNLSALGFRFSLKVPLTQRSRFSFAQSTIVKHSWNHIGSFKESKSCLDCVSVAGFAGGLPQVRPFAAWQKLTIVIFETIEWPSAWNTVFYEVQAPQAGSVARGACWRLWKFKKALPKTGVCLLIPIMGFLCAGAQDAQRHFGALSALPNAKLEGAWNSVFYKV